MAKAHKRLVVEVDEQLKAELIDTAKKQKTTYKEIVVEAIRARLAELRLLN